MSQRLSQFDFGWHRSRLILLLVLSSYRWACASEHRPHRDSQVRNLQFLRHCYTPPSGHGDSNHYFDLVSARFMPMLAAQLGLTNNHTLFVDSHGMAVRSLLGRRYAFYASQALDPRHKASDFFTEQDFAAVLGSQVSTIRTIFISGCNREGRLNASAFHKAFPNVTHIIHAPAGAQVFRPMVVQTLALHSSELRTLYSRAPLQALNKGERDVYELPVEGGESLEFFVADVFRPGSDQTVLRIKAGRELLQPDGRP